MRGCKRIVPALLMWSLWAGCSTAEPTNSKRSQAAVCRTTNTELTPEIFPELGSERIKIAYGPFSAPSSSDNHGMRGFKCVPPPPCKDCTLLYMHAGLEYADGEDAIVETGMMLHHAVFENSMRKDPMCARKRNERFFASGDERTPVDLTSGGLAEFGYMLHSKDEIALSLEIMNMEEETKDVYLTVVWEYFPTFPKSFKPVQPYWFDVGGYGSSRKPAEEDSVFQYSSPTVKAPTSGKIALAIAHLHNGGTHLELARKGNQYCTSLASYDNEHITGMTTCHDLSYSEGDEFSITAYYDTNKHAPMRHRDKKLEAVMGIALIYAVEDGRHHHRQYWKKVGKTIGIFFGLAMVLSLGTMWYRQRRRDAKDVVPVWLRRQYKDCQSVLDNRWQTTRSRHSYEPLLQTSDPDLRQS